MRIDVGNLVYSPEVHMEETPGLAIEMKLMLFASSEVSIWLCNNERRVLYGKVTELMPVHVSDHVFGCTHIEIEGECHYLLEMRSLDSADSLDRTPIEVAEPAPRDFLAEQVQENVRAVLARYGIKEGIDEPEDHPFEMEFDDDDVFSDKIEPEGYMEPELPTYALYESEAVEGEKDNSGVSDAGESEQQDEGHDSGPGEAAKDTRDAAE